MDPSEHSTEKSPKKELQGPRPTPLKLKVRKDSHKIKKPPVVPHQQHQLPPHHQAPPLPRPPIIIYTVSPKVIHANPSEFMSLVQRLTGLNSSSSSSTSSLFPFQENTNNTLAISPAARLASIEKTRTTKGSKKSQISTNCDMEMVDEGIEINREIDRSTSGLLPQGILSPNPASLQPIPSNFFSPPSAGFFNDLSPVLHNSRNYFEHNNYLPSPSNFISPRIILSPNTPSFDLFNNLFDHNREK